MINIKLLRVSEISLAVGKSVSSLDKTRRIFHGAANLISAIYNRNAGSN